MASDHAPALFRREGGRFAPTGIGTSPWTGRTIGGVPLAALSAYLMEALPAAAAMEPARLTVDILGPAPLAPLEGEARVVRDGRRVQLCEAELRSGARTWARATLLRVRDAETPAGNPLPPPCPPPAAGTQHSDLADSTPAPGPARPRAGARWVRFKVATVAGTALSPLERAAMLADWGSGIAPLLPLAEWTLANLDITLNLVRAPRGDWLLIDAESASAGRGTGLATAQLYDRDGLFGRSAQTVFPEPR